MRKLVANLALSLDGRIAGPAGEYDMSWIVPHAITDGARTHMVAVTSPATTALLGRKNYQGFGGFWPAIADDENADPKDRTFSRWLNEVDKVVFTSTLTEVEWANARLADGDPATVVKQLREQGGGDIIVLASMSVIRQLLAAGEVDRLSITLCPEVIGGGARIFEDGLPGASWALTSSTTTESGALCLLYDKKEIGK
ncbi:dihydrofolate reductase family protein [Actinocrispum sp. NPDC049592]|uniref:dihydrofolate reductase family protein n=1 Tax=Actinocrispum sp. NPDC049592 TaxID=3154835 RepID=UPI00343FA24E